MEAGAKGRSMSGGNGTGDLAWIWEVVGSMVGHVKRSSVRAVESVGVICFGTRKRTGVRLPFLLSYALFIFRTVDMIRQIALEFSHLCFGVLCCTLSEGYGGAGWFFLSPSGCL